MVGRCTTFVVVVAVMSGDELPQPARATAPNLESRASLRTRLNFRSRGSVSERTLSRGRPRRGVSHLLSCPTGRAGPVRQLTLQSNLSTAPHGGFHAALLTWLTVRRHRVGDHWTTTAQPRENVWLSIKSQAAAICARILPTREVVAE